MKFIGFIKEQDKNISTAKLFNEMFTSTSNDEILVHKVINYLKNGAFVTGAMSYIYDDENKPIGNLDYFTDGHLIWPVYYPYYLEKYKNFSLDPLLTAHLLKNKFSIPTVSEDRIAQIDREFSKEWSKRST
jgi:hypothetical protein